MTVDRRVFTLIFKFPCFTADSGRAIACLAALTIINIAFLLKFICLYSALNAK